MGVSKKVVGSNLSSSCNVSAQNPFAHPNNDIHRMLISAL